MAGASFRTHHGTREACGVAGGVYPGCTWRGVQGCIQGCVQRFYRRLLPYLPVYCSLLPFLLRFLSFYACSRTVLFIYFGACGYTGDVELVEHKRHKRCTRCKNGVNGVNGVTYYLLSSVRSLQGSLSGNKYNKT